MINKTINYLAFLSSYIQFNIRRKYRANKILNSINEFNVHIENLRNHGYSVIQGLLTKEVCSAMRDQVDSAIDAYPDAVWKGSKGADQRIFGIDLCGGVFNDFFANQILHQIGESYFECQIINLLTLAGRIDAVDGNIGSGEGWHRDANHFQYKAIVYLSDVNIENGPFQLIAKSHHLGRALIDSSKMQLDNYLQTRFTDKEVSQVLNDEPERLITFTAPAGTVLLVDTSAIHRGSPINEGRRYALFNYYYPYYDISGRLEKFFPRLRKEMLANP